MLSVSIHRDLTKYKPKVFLGLTARTLIFTALAIAASVGLGAYLYYAQGIAYDEANIPIMAVSLPFWALGFIHPLGLELEEWLPLWLRHTFGTTKLFYSTKARYEASCLIARTSSRKERHARLSKAYRWLRRRRGIEFYSPAELAPDD